jgi:hypothetical protein
LLKINVYELGTTTIMAYNSKEEMVYKGIFHIEPIRFQFAFRGLYYNSQIPIELIRNTRSVNLYSTDLTCSDLDLSPLTFRVMIIKKEGVIHQFYDESAGFSIQLKQTLDQIETGDYILFFQAHYGDDSKFRIEDLILEVGN